MELGVEFYLKSMQEEEVTIVKNEDMEIFYACALEERSSQTSSTIFRRWHSERDSSREFHGG